MAELLHVVIRTPYEAVVDASFDSVRVPTKTGQVGLRPREEPFLLAVEPGLVVLRSGGKLRFVATGGGLLDASRAALELFTPFAAASDSAKEVLGELDRVLAAPAADFAIRKRFGELEQRIAEELRKNADASNRGALRHGRA